VFEKPEGERPMKEERGGRNGRGSERERGRGRQQWREVMERKRCGGRGRKRRGMKI
jgi:hypothetical protein